MPIPAECEDCNNINNKPLILSCSSLNKERCILSCSQPHISRDVRMSSLSTYGPVTTSGTVTSYVPLTSAWSAPAKCSSLFLDWDRILYLNSPQYENVVARAPACLPPQISPWWYQSLNTASPTLTLLGGYEFLCPEAYTTIYSVVLDSTTTIGCCPWYVTDLMMHNPSCQYANSGNAALIPMAADYRVKAPPRNAPLPFLPGLSPTSSKPLIRLVVFSQVPPHW